MALADDPETIARLLNQVAKHASTKFNTSASEAVRQTLPQRPFPSSAQLHSHPHPSSPSSATTTTTTTAATTVSDPDTLSFLSLQLSHEGAGLETTVDELLTRIGPSLANSAGPRYFGLVVGGVTPAAFVADWIVTTYDQNTILHSDESMSGYSVITEQAMQMVVDLFDLPRVTGPRNMALVKEDGNIKKREEETLFRAMTTTGSTASNVVGMAVGRQWLGKYVRGVDYGQDGYDGQVVVVTNMAHATVWKAASILGIGRKQVVEVAAMGMGDAGGEEKELKEVVRQLRESGKAVLVFLAFGEVNTGIFPRNTRRIAEICKEYDAYFHIDGAFGIFARCSPEYAHLADGLELAHSITACGHKWLNVPYDCGLFIYRQSLEKPIMEPLFSSSAAYLRPSETPFSHPMNISIENSQRFRSLPVWATLRAYGREGYRRIVENNCRFAKTMYDWMKFTRPDLYEVLTDECPLNIVVFAGKTSLLSLPSSVGQEQEQDQGQGQEQGVGQEELERQNAALLKRINQTGVAYFSPTVWKGRPAIRAAISNWKTTVQLDWEPVRAMLEEQAQNTAT
ncbi:hypothetical protein EDD11_002000 [Mortierella claussenii]|nr:hypothetical protein EDD11_002000 [Mortierella claussenii]